MPGHTIFFLLTLSFLSGIVCASLGLTLLLSIIPAAVVFAALFATNVDARIAACASLFLFAGSSFYFLDDHRYQTLVAQVPREGEVPGLIESDPRKSNDITSFYITTAYGRILVESSLGAPYHYGDIVNARGSLKAPGDFETYLAKEHVVATMRDPKITILDSGQGNIAYAFIFRIRDAVRDSFDQLFNPEEAALLSGLTIGINEDFSPAFLQNLSISGTRHLTAVSGSHMTVVVFVVFGFFAYLFMRRYAFVLTFIVVTFFVALTGFAASAIRAGLMAFLVELAKETRRVYAPHNAIAFSALVLSLWNPKILAFDVGFQLSFIAVIGIIYLVPMIQGIFHLNTEPGIFHWRESLLMTVAALIGTAPILIVQFQNFSLTALAANLLVLSAIPLIMVVGFLVALCAFVLYPLSFLLSYVLAPLLQYVIFIVNLFGNFALLFNPPLGFIGVVLYYSALIGAMYWYYREEAEAEKKQMERAKEVPIISAEASEFEIIEIK